MVMRWRSFSFSLHPASETDGTIDLAKIFFSSIIFHDLIFKITTMAELKRSSDSPGSSTERITLIKLQIAENHRVLLGYKSGRCEDDEIDDLLALNEYAAKCLENLDWPIRYIEEFLAALSRRMEGLGSRQERYSCYPCFDIQGHTRRSAISTLPPPA